MTTNKLDGLYCILPLNCQKMMLIIVHCCVESTLISFACMWQRHPVNLFPFKAAETLNLLSSPKQVTKHLMIMYTCCLRQNYSYIDELRKILLAGSAITQSKEVIITNVLSFWCIICNIPQRHELFIDACICNFRETFGCKILLCSVSLVPFH